MSDKPMTPVQRKVYEIIREIEDIKKCANKFPTAVSLMEISNSIMIEIKEAINKLSMDGKLSWYKTVNGIPMFGIKQQQ